MILLIDVSDCGQCNLTNYGQIKRTDGGKLSGVQGRDGIRRKMNKRGVWRKGVGRN